MTLLNNFSSSPPNHRITTVFTSSSWWNRYPRRFFFRNGDNQKSLGGQIWALGWVIELAEAAFSLSILDNVRPVHRSVVVLQQYAPTQLPATLPLHSVPQLLQDVGVISTCDGLLVCMRVNQQYAMNIPEHGEHDLAGRRLFSLTT